MRAVAPCGITPVDAGGGAAVSGAARTMSDGGASENLGLGVEETRKFWEEAYL